MINKGGMSTDSQNSVDDLKTESIRSSLQNPKFRKPKTREYVKSQMSDRSKRDREKERRSMGSLLSQDLKVEINDFTNRLDATTITPTVLSA